MEAQLHFPLDETTGAQGAVLMPGARGNAVRFNGYTSYLKKSYDASSLSTTQQTISLWCAPETYPMMNVNEAENAWTSIVETTDEQAHSGFAFRLSSQGDWKFETYSDGWLVSINADTKLPLYQWNHIVAVMDVSSRSITLYNNGVKVGEGRTMSTLSAGSGKMIIGKDSKTLTYGSFIINTFNGLIDDICIDNAVWSNLQLADNTPDNTADLIYPADAFYANVLRPHFHGMPMMGWTNETHGLFYKDGLYHLFFQKNPNGPYMARLHWGHLSSTDLCGWQEENIAVAPSEQYDIKGCWSGCVFADSLITGGQPWIAYTGVDNGRATIDFAMPASADLSEWHKAENNPRINGRPAGLSDDFRDPYFFRNGDNAYMIVGSSKDGIGVTTLHRFDANGNLSNSGELFFQGTDASSCGTFFEMPNVTKMGDKWLFTATPLGSSVGVRTVYWTGTIDANGHFVPDVATPRTVELPGFARDGYGMLSPSICQHDGKTIALGIVPDKLPSTVNYDMGWAHSYSLPREWRLSADGELLQQPHSGLTDLRTDTCYQTSELALNGKQTVTGVTNGLQVEVDAEFAIKGGNMGINLLSDGNNAMHVYYEQAGNRLVVDMREITRRENDKGVFDGLYSSVLPESYFIGDTIRLHLYLDHSVLDVFVDNKWASSFRLFSAANVATGVELFTGSLNTVVRAAAYNLETTAHAKTYDFVTPQPDVIGCYDAIEDVFVSDQMENAVIYNILGQRISIEDAKNGVFIVNGKKKLIY